MMGMFTLFSVFYEGIEAVQRMVDPSHSHVSMAMDEKDEGWMVGLVGLGLNAAAVAVFRQHRLQSEGWALFGSVEDSSGGAFSGAGGVDWGGGGAAAAGGAAARRRGRDELLEGVHVLAVAELTGRLAAGVGDALGGGIAEDCVALLAAVVGCAVALPLTHRTARMLLQASASALQHRLSRAIIEAGLLDGVVECRSPHFWEHTPGRYIGSLTVRLRRGADEQSVRSCMQWLLLSL